MKDSSIIFLALVGLGLVLYNRHQDGSNGVLAGKQSATIVPAGNAAPGSFNAGVQTTSGGGQAGLPGLIAAGEPSPCILGQETSPASKMTIAIPVDSVGVQDGHPLSFM